jgi:DNA-binding MarR family transcriptional regulator
MASKPNPDCLVNILGATMVALVAGDGRDLTARQLAIVLACYLREGPHTVRGLAAGLNVAKPSITRAIDRLVELELVVRRPDPWGHRSITVERTVKGAKLLRDLRTIMAEAAAMTTP